MLVAAALLTLLGWLDIWRQWDSSGTKEPGGAGDMTFAMVAFTVVGLFIAQALITAADVERKYVASYNAYFEIAWKFEIQLLLSAVFVGVFWGVLWLGAVLFNLINLSFIQTLIEKPWFAIPASTLATAAALHATDVRSRLIAGVRTVAHTLLSWLLPLMVLIAVGFTLSLLFTGLQPLWATKSAAGLLLTAAGVLVILINAAYQDGDPLHNRAAIMRWSEFAAALVLVPFVLIATYALWLRVAQYGWTVERVLTAATILIALAYAFGYAAGAILSLRSGVWMALVSRVNVAAALLVVAVLFLLLTPIADPARLAVNSQVARLTSGAVSATRFDYDYLHNEGGRYGRAALSALSVNTTIADSATVRKQALAAATGTPLVAPPPSKMDIAANVTVYPRGRSLPASFLSQDWRQDSGASTCLTSTDVKCDAYFGDFDGDGSEDIAVVSNFILIGLSGVVYTQSADHKWTAVASFNSTCGGIMDALRDGKGVITTPKPPFRDWTVGGVVLHPPPVAPDPCPAR
jgi:hypothetical protein